MNRVLHSILHTNTGKNSLPAPLNSICVNLNDLLSSCHGEPLYQSSTDHVCSQSLDTFLRLNIIRIDWTNSDQVCLKGLLRVLVMSHVILLGLVSWNQISSGCNDNISSRCEDRLIISTLRSFYTAACKCLNGWTWIILDKFISSHMFLFKILNLTVDQPI